WEPATSKLITSLAASNNPINALVFSPTGNLFSAGEDNQLTQWDHRNGTRVQTLLVPVSPQASNSSQRSGLPSAGERLSLALHTPQTVEPRAARSVAGTISRFMEQALDWLIPSASAATLPGAGHPILLITAAPATFSTFYKDTVTTE